MTNNAEREAFQRQYGEFEKWALEMWFPHTTEELARLTAAARRYIQLLDACGFAIADMANGQIRHAGIVAMKKAIDALRSGV